MFPTIDVTRELSDRKSNLNPPDAISGNFSRRNICLKYIFNIQMTLFSSQFCLVVRFNPFSWKRDFFLPSWYFSIWPNSEKLMFAIVRHVDSDGKSNLSPTPGAIFCKILRWQTMFLQKTTNIYKKIFTKGNAYYPPHVHFLLQDSKMAESFLTATHFCIWYFWK